MIRSSDIRGQLHLNCIHVPFKLTLLQQVNSKVFSTAGAQLAKEGPKENKKQNTCQNFNNTGICNHPKCLFSYTCIACQDNHSKVNCHLLASTKYVQLSPSPIRGHRLTLWLKDHDQDDIHILHLGCSTGFRIHYNGFIPNRLSRILATQKRTRCGEDFFLALLSCVLRNSLF